MKKQYHAKIGLEHSDNVEYCVNCEHFVFVYKVGGTSTYICAECGAEIG